MSDSDALTKKHMVPLSHLVCDLHTQEGHAAVWLYEGTECEDGVVPAKLDVKNVLEVKGRRLRAKADVRRFLYESPRHIRERLNTVVWSAYDEERDVSVLGTGQAVACAPKEL